MSNMPEGRPATIASGPTLPDPTTLDTCYAVASKYKLLEKFPPAIRELFANKKLQETPKEGAEAFQRSQSFVVLSNHDVLHAAHRAAGERRLHRDRRRTARFAGGAGLHRLDVRLLPRRLGPRASGLRHLGDRLPQGHGGRAGMKS